MAPAPAVVPPKAPARVDGPSGMTYNDMFVGPSSSSSAQRNVRFPANSDGSNLRSNSSDRERKRLMEELIREGPGGGPNRDKVLQELRTSRTSTSTSSSSSSSRPSERGRGPYGRTRPRNGAGSGVGVTTTAAVAAGDSPAEDGVLPEDTTTSMGGAGGSMGGMYGGSGGMGMGSMGGMGMGGMGGVYGMYGMGMSPMMMGGGYGMGPLSWVYSLNAMVHSVGYAVNVIGMNSHMLHQLFLQLWTALQHVADVVKRSKIRRWLQQKSRRSAALRAAFVLVAMGLAHQAVKLAKAIVAAHRRQQLMLTSH